jgi:two-component system, chemotaxis family, sensor kinase CheA
MGDGKVALILDVLGIAHRSNVVSKDRGKAMHEGAGRAKEGGGSTQNLLLLGTETNRRLAIPISQVARLEKIPMDSIEYTENQEVVQYRGEILPLVRLADVLGIPDGLQPVDGLLNVIVYIENEQSYGLVVNKIVDIVETSIAVKQPSQRNGLFGSAIIQEHVTDFVDLPAVIQQIAIYSN